MKTDTVKPKAPFFTGWCGLRLPPESHRRCRETYGDQRCVCPCHQTCTSCGQQLPTTTTARSTT